MTDKLKLPSAGGSYVRTPSGALQVSGEATKPAPGKSARKAAEAKAAAITTIPDTALEGPAAARTDEGAGGAKSSPAKGKKE